MGEAEIIISRGQILIHSHIITYGSAASEELTYQIRDEIESMWNEPKGKILLDEMQYLLIFKITTELKTEITELEVLQNTDPRNNYFRIEEFAHGNISFVDGLGSNTGYFKLENLYKGSTTAAHEFGHTLGLGHPRNVDIRSKGVPGIMYPRGTLVDAQYQYDPSRPAGVTGGTMHPMYRKVKQRDIDYLQIEKINFNKGKGVIGDFTNIYHWNHAESPLEDFIKPPIFG